MSKLGNCHSPLVSIIMPVFNAEQHLSASIESILNQSYQEFEFIVVDDGSTDNSKNIILEYKDIRLICQDNKGVASAINTGLSIASGKYIARMDADDVSFINRLEKQVDFLENRQDIGLVGSQVRLINEAGIPIGHLDVPESDLEIRWTSLLLNPFIHPAVMFRKRLLNDYNLSYDESFYAEDYDLWTRMLRVTKGWNIQTPLVKVRLNISSISNQKVLKILEDHVEISIRTINENGLNKCIDCEDATRLATIMARGKRINPSIQRQRAKLVKPYLELWKCFEDKYQIQNQKLSLKNGVLSKAGRMSLIPPFQRGMFEALKTLYRNDKIWWWWFISRLPKTLQFLWIDRFTSLDGKIKSA